MLFAFFKVSREHGLEVWASPRQDYSVGIELSILNLNYDITEFTLFSEGRHAAEGAGGVIFICPEHGKFEYFDLWW